MLILRDLLMNGTMRFKKLQRSIDRVSQKVLTDNLKALEADEIITRTVYPEVPVRVEYALSGIGESMRPVIMIFQRKGFGRAEAYVGLERGELVVFDQLAVLRLCGHGFSLSALLSNGLGSRARALDGQEFGQEGTCMEPNLLL